ncbi:MAG: PD-(D/E)XK nuclease family protein [Lachnospiraceae bacterium]|nr:PD-(D/E)XK nuclease family protein [Lachnospiraceae bacterium]
MKLKEFIKNNPTNTKIILTNKVSVGNALIRMCNIREKVSSFNIMAKTLFDIAREILSAKIQSPVNYLSPEGSTYLMMNVLRDINSTLLPESTLTLPTAKEVMLRVNELRENGVTDKYAEAIKSDEKIRELDTIRKAFETTLETYGDNEGNGLYDRCRVIKEATEICKKSDITMYVPYLRNAAFADLETNRWSTVEKDFLNALLSSVEGNSKQPEIIEFLEKDIKTELSFFKARGMTNEVRHVAGKIKEIAEEESCGTVALYYSSPEYLNVIKAVLDAERIPYCLSEGRPTQELYLTQFFISLLDSAEKDFSYELLEKVVRNRVITFDNVLKPRDASEAEEEDADTAPMTEAEMENSIAELLEEELAEETGSEKADRDSVRVNPIRGYRQGVSAGIGWGRERYIAYYERVINSKDSKENEKVFARFLYDFVSVFDDDLSIGEMYRKLWEFVQLYTYSKNKEKAILNNALYEKWNEMMLIDSTGYSLHKKIVFIRDMIENLKVDDLTLKGEAVCVFPLRDLFVMERKHNFMVGLSATAFAADDKQSPLILDEQKLKVIQGAGNDDSPVEIAGRNYERLSEKVKRSLRTGADDSDVTISYSYYDSVKLQDSSPSVLFLELSDTKEIEEAPGYTDASYILKDDILLSVDEIERSIQSRADRIEQEREAKKEKRDASKGNSDKKTDGASEEKTLQEFSMSASGIQTLLKCPLMYYYQYTKHLSIDDQMTPKGHEWLNASNKGNICHKTMEKYMSAATNPAAGVDHDLFERSFAEALKEIEEVQPAYSEVIKRREIEYYKKMIGDYIEFLCDIWAEDLSAGKEWKVIGCEIPFGKEDETGLTKPVYADKDQNYEIYLNGYIDRADGYMDKNGKLMLRILDYKTGKFDKMSKSIDLFIQIQHYIYAMALEEYLESDAGKDRCKELFGKVYADYEFEWVGYTFPYAEKDEDRLLNTLDLIIQRNIVRREADPDNYVPECITTFPEEVSSQLDDIIGNMRTGNEDLVADIMDKLIHEKRAERKDEKDKTPGFEMSLKKFCDDNYCKYRDICRNWIGYTEHDEEDEEEEEG